MVLVKEKLTVDQLHEIATRIFGTFVKAVVDVRLGKMVIDTELHSDGEAFLVEQGSALDDLWGINLYPQLDRSGDDFIEYSSMINLRPSRNNLSREVEDSGLRERIRTIVHEWIS